MAGEFKVIYSEFVQGGALICSGPFAETPSLLHQPDEDALAENAIKAATTVADKGEIDPLSNLKD